MRLLLLALALGLTSVACDSGSDDPEATDAGDGSTMTDGDADTPSEGGEGDGGGTDTGTPDTGPDEPEDAGTDSMTPTGDPEACEEVVLSNGDVGAECGAVIVDGITLFPDCGDCTAPEFCGGGGVDNQCGCAPATCDSLGADCGTNLDDGCGGTIDSCGDNAGACADSQDQCIDNECTCVPSTCASLGYECNPGGMTLSDGCTGQLVCGDNGGDCTGGDVCGSGGQCGCTDTPDNCPDGLSCNASNGTCECDTAGGALCNGKTCGFVSAGGCQLECGAGCGQTCASLAACTDCDCAGDEVCFGGSCCAPDCAGANGHKRCGTAGDDQCGNPNGCTCDAGESCVSDDFITDSESSLCYPDDIANLVGQYYGRMNGFVGATTPPVTRADALSVITIQVNTNDQLTMTDQGCAATSVSQAYSDQDGSLQANGLISVAPAYIDLDPAIVTMGAAAAGKWERDNLPNVSGANATGGTPVGWEPDPSFCSGQAGNSVTPPAGSATNARPWLNGGTCVCPASDGNLMPPQVAGPPDMDSLVTDCRVVDADDDGLPGFSLRAVLGGSTDFTTRLVTRSGAKWDGDIADDGRHTGLQTDIASADRPKVRRVASCVSVEGKLFNGCSETVAPADWSCGGNFNLVQFVPAGGTPVCEDFYKPEAGPIACTDNGDCTNGPCRDSECQEVDGAFIAATFAGAGTCAGNADCENGHTICSDGACVPMTMPNSCDNGGSSSGNGVCWPGWACGTDGACWPASCDDPND